MKNCTIIVFSIAAALTFLLLFDRLYMRAFFDHDRQLPVLSPLNLIGILKFMPVVVIAGVVLGISARVKLVTGLKILLTLGICVTLSYLLLSDPCSAYTDLKVSGRVFVEAGEVTELGSLACGSYQLIFGVCYAVVLLCIAYIVRKGRGKR